MSASEGRARSGAAAVASAVAGRLPWIVDGYRAARNPRWALDLRHDLAATRTSTAFLRALPAPDPHAEVALVGLYRDNIYEAKLDLVLLTALRLHGLRPVVLIPSGRAQRLQRYARAFGVRDVIVHDRIRISPPEHAEIDAVRERLLATSLDFDSVKRWRFRGYDIGNHVLSTLIRVTFDGSPDLLVEENRTRVRPILDEVLQNVVRDERLLDDLEPQLLLVDEANYSVNGPLVDAAVRRSIDVIQTVPSWRDDALVSKRITSATRRVDAHSVSPETLARVASEPWSARHDEEVDADFDARYGGVYAVGRQNQPRTEPRTPGQIRDELGLDDTRKTAVIFAHVLWDASLFYGVDLFANYSEWLMQTVAAAAANTNVNWIVKAHPSNVFRAEHGFASEASSELTLISREFPVLPSHVVVVPSGTRISTRSLYAFADVGITVRGTPGMEMACYGKPVLTAGTGSYSGLGFTIDSSTREEYLDRIAHVQELAPLDDAATTRARQYVHALFVQRPWSMGAFRVEFNFVPGQWHPLDQNLQLEAANLDELGRMGDLDAWARWAIDGAEADFVAGARC